MRFHEFKTEDNSDRGMNKYGLAARNKDGKFYSYRHGKLTGTFDNMADLQKHQQDLIKDESVKEGADFYGYYKDPKYPDKNYMTYPDDMEFKTPHRSNANVRMFLSRIGLDPDFENTGSISEARFEQKDYGLKDETSNLESPHPFLVDLDGDGDIDSITGESSGNLLYLASQKATVNAGETVNLISNHAVTTSFSTDSLSLQTSVTEVNDLPIVEGDTS